MTTYYHGGSPNLRMILPSKATGARSMVDYGGQGVTRRNRVYVVTSNTVAAMYAAMHPCGGGVIYEVHPIGSLEPDPDFHGDGEDGVLSYQCPKARVLKTHALSRQERDEIRRALLERL